MNVVGIVLNRMVKDIKYVELAERLPILQELRDAEPSEIDALSTPPEEREPVLQRRSTMALWSSLGLAALSGVLTTIGLVAALWHMAWWVGVAGLLTALVSATHRSRVRIHQAAGVRGGQGPDPALGGAPHAGGGSRRRVGRAA